MKQDSLNIILRSFFMKEIKRKLLPDMKISKTLEKHGKGKLLMIP